MHPALMSWSSRTAKGHLTAALLVTCLLLLPRPASAGLDGDALEGFHHELLQIGDYCRTAPALACLELSWIMIDLDADNRVSTEELTTFKADLLTWSDWLNPKVRERERQGLALASLMINALEPQEMITKFDSDGDGLLAMPELTQDMQLDERPLLEILGDQEAVDWPALSKRLGPASLLLAGLAASLR